MSDSDDASFERELDLYIAMTTTREALIMVLTLFADRFPKQGPPSDISYMLQTSDELTRQAAQKFVTAWGGSAAVAKRSKGALKVEKIKKNPPSKGPFH